MLLSGLFLAVGTAPRRIGMKQSGAQSKRFLVLTDFSSVNLKVVWEYLSHLHSIGLAYRMVILHCSVLSATLPSIDGHDMGHHPIISCLICDIFLQCSPDSASSIHGTLLRCLPSFDWRHFHWTLPPFNARWHFSWQWLPLVAHRRKCLFASVHPFLS